MNELREAIRLALTTSLSNRRIGTTVGLSHTTIAKYRKAIAQQQRDWQAIDSLNDTDIEHILRASRTCLQTKRLPDWAYVHKEMQRPKVTLQTLWEEYAISDPETAYSYSSFARKYDNYRRKLDLSMRQSHRAGECVFVDFAGTTVPWTNLVTNEKHCAQVFVGALGCSNYTYVCALASQSLPDWIDAHNKMFQYFGGTPELIVPDNLKAAVTRAGSEPRINRTYLELGKHYNVVIVPARVRRPKDKSKAEVAVQIATRWILVKLRNWQFFSLEEINRAISGLLERLNNRPFKRLPGCRRSRFEEMDKPRLHPLPEEPFEFAEWTSKQKVGADYHVPVRGHYYSVPYQLVGSKVEARATKNAIELFSLGKRVASHIRSSEISGHTTHRSHQPKSHRLYAEQTAESMLEWSEAIGDASFAVVQHQFRSGKHEVVGLRACRSLQRLAKEHGHERFEAACKRAQLIGSLTLKSVRSILRRRLIDAFEEDTPTQIDLPLHNNVRGADYYNGRR